jgi:hypothetical protein
MKKLRRAYLYLANRDYGRVESELNTFVSPFIFGRHLKPNKVSFLEWDLIGIQLTDKRDEDNVWDVYHFHKCASYFPSRTFLVIDRITWNLFESRTPNMILMDQPNWVSLINNSLESK